MGDDHVATTTTTATSPNGKNSNPFQRIQQSIQHMSKGRPKGFASPTLMTARKSFPSTSSSGSKNKKDIPSRFHR
jgi:hypothetical protein